MDVSGRSAGVLAGWLGGVSPPVTSTCLESCRVGGETPPGQPPRRQRSDPKAAQ